MLERMGEPWSHDLLVRGRREEQGCLGSPQRRETRDPGRERARTVKMEKEIQETRAKIQELLWRRAGCFPRHCRRHRPAHLLLLARSQTGRLRELSCPPGQTLLPRSLGCSCPGDTSELSHTSFSSGMVYTIAAAAQVHSVHDTFSCCRSGLPCRSFASSSLGPACNFPLGSNLDVGGCDAPFPPLRAHNMLLALLSTKHATSCQEFG